MSEAPTDVAPLYFVLSGMGRIRDVRQGLDGYIYLAIEDSDAKPTPIYRLEPVERTTVR